MVQLDENHKQHVGLLNDLVDMQQSMVYAARKGVLVAAENLIVSLLTKISQLETDATNCGSNLDVWYGAMPESNGKSNWTAVLYNNTGDQWDIASGFTLARSEYPHRVRYDADCIKHMLGKIPNKPDILEYDGDVCDNEDVDVELLRPQFERCVIKECVVRNYSDPNVALVRHDNTYYITDWVDQAWSVWSHQYDE